MPPTCGCTATRPAWTATSGLKRFHAALWDAFPDAELGVEDTVVEGDRAALRYRLTGTHRGRYLGVAPPAGRSRSPG